MKVNMMHGAGGEVMGELLQTLTKFRHNNAGGIGLEAMDDGAVIPFKGENLVFTTDSHVVRPIFFPGGDIGRISVCGTINDLAMMGGKPIALSCGMIIEEGFEIDDLARIVSSMDEALGEAGANLVTGDTKVMERGALDGIVINTAGIGVAKTIVRDNGLVPGDVIMVHREGFDLGEQIKSDVSPLWGLVEKVLDAGTVHAMKDPTRGGFASAINEMARKSGVSVRVQEEKIPVRKNVRSAAGMLGIDPLEVANEGKVVMGVPAACVDAVLDALHSHKYGKDAAVVGTVTKGAHVIMETAIGGERFIEPPLGDPVPRVC
jgi:hydrogenase expression/formation protein HypE